MIQPGSCDTSCISCALQTIGRSRFLQIPQTGLLRQTLLSCDGSWFLLFSLLKQCFYPLCMVSSPRLLSLCRSCPPLRFLSRKLFFQADPCSLLRADLCSHTVSPVSSLG